MSLTNEEVQAVKGAELINMINAHGEIILSWEYDGKQ